MNKGGKNGLNKEQAILEAAEKVFLERGFPNTKTTDIAKEAGVTHAMLHYYFRTKENLFKMVFRKVSLFISKKFEDIFDRDLPFLEKVEVGIRTHFRILVARNRLPYFVYSEIIKNEERKQEFLSIFLPTVAAIEKKIQESINEEVSKGCLRDINARDLILNIVSLNAFAALANPFFSNKEEYEAFLEDRLKNNIHLIINDLKHEI